MRMPQILHGQTNGQNLHIGDSTFFSFFFPLDVMKLWNEVGLNVTISIHLPSTFLRLEGGGGYFHYLRNPYWIHSVSYNGRNVKIMLTETCNLAIVPCSFLLGKRRNSSSALKTHNCSLYALQVRRSDAVSVRGMGLKRVTSGSLSWRVLRLRMQERAPDMEGSCERIELAVAEGRQGVVL